VGVNLINYPIELTTQTTNMVSSKLLWNSTISTPGARFGGSNIKNMYLEMPLNSYEYMKMPLTLLPAVSIEGITTYTTRLSTDTSSWKSKRACMASLKLEFLPTSSSRNDMQDMGTTNSPTLPAYGSMTLTPSGSTMLSTTLESNTSVKTASNTSTMPYAKKHMKLLKTA
jgi:hypothetical protein